MNPYNAYRESYSRGWTRVDMLLALFDGAIERLEMAAASCRDGDRMATTRLLTRAGLIVCELAAGVEPNYVHAKDFLRMYGLASRAIAANTPEGTDAALRVLRAMRGSVAALRDEASRLEHEGALPPAGATRLVELTA
jgi:flagellin-specific chaperone FliS